MMENKLTSNLSRSPGIDLEDDIDRLTGTAAEGNMGIDELRVIVGNIAHALREEIRVSVEKVEPAIQKIGPEIDRVRKEAFTLLSVFAALFAFLFTQQQLTGIGLASGIGIKDIIRLQQHGGLIMLLFLGAVYLILNNISKQIYKKIIITGFGIGIVILIIMLSI